MSNEKRSIGTLCFAWDFHFQLKKERELEYTKTDFKVVYIDSRNRSNLSLMLDVLHDACMRSFLSSPIHHMQNEYLGLLAALAFLFIIVLFLWFVFWKLILEPNPLIRDFFDLDLKPVASPSPSPATFSSTDTKKEK